MTNVIFSAVLTLILIAPAKLFASEVETEFEFQLMRKDFLSWVNQQVAAAKYQTFSREFSTDLSSAPDVGLTAHHMRGKLTGQISNLSMPSDDWKIFFMIDRLDLSLQIDEVVLKKIITVDRPGFHGQFQVEARCQNLNLNLNGRLSAAVQLGTNNDELDLKLQNVDWQANTDSVRLLMASCTGAEGFAELLEQEVKNNLANKISYINTYVEDYLRQQLGLYRSWKKIENKNPKLAFWSLMQRILITPDSIVLTGLLRAQFDDGKTNHQYQFRLDPSERRGPYHGGANFKIPAQFLAKLAQLTLSSQISTLELRSTEVPAFSHLLKSRFMQFFIWPDLMNYSKKSIFILKPNSNYEPQIFMQKEGWNFSWTIATDLWGPREGEYQKLLRLKTAFSGQIFLKQNKNGFVLRSAILSTKYNIQWDENYVRKFEPNQRIAKNMLYSGIDKMLEKNQISWEIPVSQILSDLKLIAQLPQLVGNDYVFTFLLQP